MSNHALIIFVKNPEKGKVKTRLAKDVGEDKAVDIYKKLLRHTYNITNELSVEKYVYYGGYIDWNDMWDLDIYNKRIQVEEDLGGRMIHAFGELYEREHDKVLIIGSDCNELSTEILQSAFNSLDDNDVVLGPTYDGGYYLIGMKKLHADLFTGKNWSTESVFEQTIKSIDENDLSYSVLPKLNDVDHKEDVPENWL